jgi:transposase-like protein
VIRKLREAERLMAEGVQVPEVAKALEVSEQTFHRWRVQYGAMTAEGVKQTEGAGAGERSVEADRGRQGARD